MISFLLIISIVAAFFVGINIGGSSTGVAFGPSVGSDVTTKRVAALLMSIFALFGGATLGKNVIKTLGKGIVPQESFTLPAAITVLSFVGCALLLSNLFGVPASTSMTAVGATAGMGLAGGFLQWRTMAEIVLWWLITPVIAFWICAVLGRYLYQPLANRVVVEQSPGPLLSWKRYYSVPIPVSLGSETTNREFIMTLIVVGIGCYMAFTAGASNVANAVGPLFGAGVLGKSFGPYALLGGAAIAVGAFSIARRTLDTVGNDLTDLPLLAALVVEVVGGSLVTFLSAIGIPASLAVSTTMCIVGLGWGRASRTASLTDVASQAVEGDTDSSEVETLDSTDLFDEAATAQVIALWLIVPSLASGASYLLFSLVPLYG